MNLARATAITLLLLVTSRLLGFLRDFSIASLFGVSIYADIAILISTLPDAIVGFLFTGGLAATMVPRLVESSPNFHLSIIKLYAIPLLIIIAATAILLLNTGPELFPLLGIPRDIQATNLVYLANVITAIAVCPLALGSILSSYCHSQNKGRVTTEGIIIFNILILIFFVIATKIYLEDLSIEIQLKYFIFTVLTAYILRSIYIFVKFIRILPSDSYQRSNDIFDYRTFLFGGLATFVFIFYPIVLRSLYAQDPSQTLSEFHYAYKIQEIGVLLIISAINLVYLPVLAGRVGRPKRFSVTFTNLLCLTFLFASICSLISYKFPNLIINVFFGLANLPDRELGTLSDNFRLFAFHIPGLTLVGMLSIVASATGTQKQYSTLLFFIFLILILLIGLSSYTFEKSLAKYSIIITICFPYMVIIGYTIINRNFISSIIPRFLRKTSFLIFPLLIIISENFLLNLGETYLNLVMTFIIISLAIFYNFRKIIHWLR